MLEANPNLTTNLIKALLQYTAQQYADPSSTTVPAKAYSPLRQGAGFLNALGAVRLAKFYRNPQNGERMPVQKVWSRTFNWGNHRIQGGMIKPDANAWATNIVWGTAKTLGALGDNIVWGTSADGEEIITYSDEVVEPLPNPALEFGDVVPLVPVTPVPVTSVPVQIGA